MRKLSIFSIVLIASLLLVVLSFGLSSWLTVPNRGTVAAIGISIFKDSGCSQALTEIDWGVCYVGVTKTYEAWLRNDGTIPVIVDLNTDSWVPVEADGALNVDWDSQGATVGVGVVRRVVFSLQVLNGAVTNFDFNMVIVGSET